MYYREEKSIKEIEEGIDQFFTSDKFRNYLDVMSKFHHYSFINTILIYNQNPEATYVAGYNTWKKLGRHVERGERGIRIFRPYLITREIKTDRYDDKGEQIVERITQTRFTSAYVFDVSQTSGQELPKLIEELEGDVSRFDTYINALKDLTDYPIEYANDLNGANGICSYEDKKIYIRNGMSQAQQLKTIVHEIAHYMRHNGSTKSRKEKEIEAESVAYVVCQNIGLDTSDYSFGYIGSWSAELEHEQRADIIRGIHDTAHQIIEHVENALAEKKINNELTADVEKNIKESVVNEIGADCDNINLKIVGAYPQPKREDVNIYMENPSYNYKGYMQASGLTKDQVVHELSCRLGNPYEILKAAGADCKELFTEPEKIHIGYNLENGNVKDLYPTKTDRISALVDYNSTKMSENEVYYRLQTALGNYNQSGVEYILNNNDSKSEKGLMRSKPHYERGRDKSIPVVTFTFTEKGEEKEVTLDIGEAAEFVRNFSDDRELKVDLQYTFNGNSCVHNAVILAGPTNIDFVQDLDVAPYVKKVLNTHIEIAKIWKQASEFAPDTTYGRKYALRMFRWLDECRCEINHNSINPVFDEVPALDEVHNIDKRGDLARNSYGMDR